MSGCCEGTGATNTAVAEMERVIAGGCCGPEGTTECQCGCTNSKESAATMSAPGVVEKVPCC